MVSAPEKLPKSLDARNSAGELSPPMVQALNTVRRGEKIPRISAGEKLLEMQLRATLPSTTEWIAEQRFVESRRWRFDFTFPNHMLAVEVEGGTFSSGRHSRGRGFEADCEKYNAATILGWRVLRFTTEMVKDGRAIATIEQALGL